MSQNDFIIADGTGEAVLNDINSALQALASNSRDSIAPNIAGATYPSQFFADESSGKLTYRDGSDPTIYYNLANLDGGIFVSDPSTFNDDVIFQGTSSFGTHKITFDADFNNGKSALKFARETKAVFGNDDLSIGIDLNFFNVINSQTTALLLVAKKTMASGLDFCYQLKTQKGDGSGQDLAYEAIEDGGQKLYFDGLLKFQTSADGIEVIGSILPTTDNDKPLGSSSKRFSTLHSGALNTGDINMSNLNDNGNEIDGSKGSWSIQEGSDDLFLINRVSGKKYKFNLTEIT